MPKTSTYTVHGHMKNRDGTQSAFWTRTRLSKAQAQKLAKEQRAEAGGVAEIVAEDPENTPPAYGKPGDLPPAKIYDVAEQKWVPAPQAKRHHATKKSPAQLQREIDEALAKRHKQARERWLSLQAGPHHRERQAAYDEMATLAQKAAGGAKRSHATMKEDAAQLAKGETRLPDAGAKDTKKAVTVKKAFNSKVERLLDQAGAQLHHEMKGVDSLDHREFLLETKAGTAHVTPLGHWVAVRFNDPEAAAKLVGTSGLNTYSGKWNHNYFAWPLNEAVSDVARWLKKIAA